MCNIKAHHTESKNFKQFCSTKVIYFGRLITLPPQYVKNCTLKKLSCESRSIVNTSSNCLEFCSFHLSHEILIKYPTLTTSLLM